MRLGRRDGGLPAVSARDFRHCSRGDALSTLPARLRPCCTPRRLALPLHVLQAFTLTRHNAEICSGSAALFSPQGQALTHRVLAHFEAARFHLVPSALQELPPAVECAAAMAHLHVSFGLALPALVQAVLEARLWQRHMAAQRQQRQQGAAAQQPGDSDDHGRQPGLYTMLLDLQSALAAHWVSAVVCAWILIGICFDVALLLSGVRGADV